MKLTALRRQQAELFVEQAEGMDVQVQPRERTIARQQVADQRFGMGHYRWRAGAIRQTAELIATDRLRRPLRAHVFADQRLIRHHAQLRNRNVRLVAPLIGNTLERGDGGVALLEFQAGDSCPS